MARSFQVPRTSLFLAKWLRIGARAISTVTIQIIATTTTGITTLKIMISFTTPSSNKRIELSEARFQANRQRARQEEILEEKNKVVMTWIRSEVNQKSSLLKQLRLTTTTTTTSVPLQKTDRGKIIMICCFRARVRVIAAHRITCREKIKSKTTTSTLFLRVQMTDRI